MTGFAPKKDDASAGAEVLLPSQDTKHMCHPDHDIASHDVTKSTCNEMIHAITSLPACLGWELGLRRGVSSNNTHCDSRASASRGFSRNSRLEEASQKEECRGGIARRR